MRQIKLRQVHSAAVAAAAILFAACLSGRSMAQQQGQKTFSSPQDASTALVAAARE